MCGLVFLAALLALQPGVAAAAERHVGNGQAYADLQTLVRSGDLAPGDTVILHSDDSSLTGNITLPNSPWSGGLTLRGAGGAAALRSGLGYAAPTASGFLNIAADSFMSPPAT